MLREQVKSLQKEKETLQTQINNPPKPPHIPTAQLNSYALKAKLQQQTTLGYTPQASTPRSQLPSETLTSQTIRQSHSTPVHPNSATATGNGGYADRRTPPSPPDSPSLLDVDEPTEPTYVIRNLTLRQLKVDPHPSRHTSTLQAGSPCGLRIGSTSSTRQRRGVTRSAGRVVWCERQWNSTCTAFCITR